MKWTHLLVGELKIPIMKEVGKKYCDTSKLSVRKISKSVAKDIVIKTTIHICGQSILPYWFVC